MTSNHRPTRIASGLNRLALFLSMALVLLFGSIPARSQTFFPLQDVRPGLRGIGRTVFEGNRVEEFQVEILGVLENLTPKQTIILARLSGGPLAETGVMQGMSGSPVYIGGKLLGAIALGFPYSKQPIAGIQPIQQMLSDSRFPNSTAVPIPAPQKDLPHPPESVEPSSGPPASFSNLTAISTPLALTGFSPRTLQVFTPDFRRLGFEPQQGVSGGSPTSQAYTGTVVPGSMISVQLLSGDLSVSADGTVTYVDGKHVYAFGHRFLDAGSTELPFARADVVATVPTLNTSFKLTSPREWVGTIVSDRSTAIAGEIGRPAQMVPLTISVISAEMGTHDYHFRVVRDRLLTPFITQTAIFSTIDATERTLGSGTLRLGGRVEFEGDLPPLLVQDIFVSDSGLAQQVASDAVVTLGFLLGGGFTDLHIKDIAFRLEPVEKKRQLHIAQVWASRHDVHPGDSVEVTALLQGENGLELTRSATYNVPVGAPLGALNITVSDANGLNTPDFAGLTQSQLRTPRQLIEAINAFRGSGAAYVRVWRQEPAFTLSGPLPGGELTDPPPSVMLILADQSASASSNAALTLTRGSGVAEVKIPLDGYVVTGSKTVQVEVHE
jgi:hypothetical protein